MKKWGAIGLLIIASFFGGVLLHRDPFKSDLRALLSREDGAITKIFFISTVNKCCRPIIRLDKTRKGEVIFKTDKSFSDEDIDNLRHSFSIPVDYKIERMNMDWADLYTKINKKYSAKGFLYNYFIILNDKEKKNIAIERF